MGSPEDWDVTESSGDTGGQAGRPRTLCERQRLNCDVACVLSRVRGEADPPGPARWETGCPPRVHGAREREPRAGLGGCGSPDGPLQTAVQPQPGSGLADAT